MWPWDSQSPMEVCGDKSQSGATQAQESSGGEAQGCIRAPTPGACKSLSLEASTSNGVVSTVSSCGPAGLMWAE